MFSENEIKQILTDNYQLISNNIDIIRLKKIFGSSFYLCIYDGIVICNTGLSEYRFYKNELAVKYNRMNVINDILK